MNSTTYKISIHGVTGAAYAMFENGVLSYFINEMERTSSMLKIMPHVSMTELQFKAHTGISIKELKPKSLSDKVALFCPMYNDLKGQPYRAMKEEKANLTHVTVTKELLNTYFKTTDFPLSPTKSMADYVRHYNAIRHIAANGKPV